MSRLGTRQRRARAGRRESLRRARMAREAVEMLKDPPLIDDMHNRQQATFQAGQDIHVGDLVALDSVGGVVRPAKPGEYVFGQVLSVSHSVPGGTHAEIVIR